MKAITTVGTLRSMRRVMHLAQRRGRRGRDRHQGPDVECGRRRLHHEHRAGEAYQDRRPAPPAHQFAVEQHRERGQDQRRDLKHGGEIGELHVHQRGDEAGGRQPVEHRADQDWFAGRVPEFPRMAQRQHRRTDQDRRHQAANEDDLADWIFVSDRLHHRVVDGVGDHAADQRKNAALIGGKGHADWATGGLSRRSRSCGATAPGACGGGR